MGNSRFFNSNGGDRRYKAEDFAEYFAALIGNGVFPNPSTGLQVMSNGNMTVTVKAGKAWINGYFYTSGDQNLTLAVADGVLARIDRIVVRWSLADRAISVAVKQGAFATNPVAPTLQRDADVYELALADISIAKGAASISQANITDKRLDTSVCGIVTALVNQVDTTTLAAQLESWFASLKTASQADLAALKAQFQTQFDANAAAFNSQKTNNQKTFDDWFTTIKNILNESVAANLQTQIDGKQAKITASGILKGNGNGGVTAAANTDFPIPEYSFYYDGNPNVRTSEIQMPSGFPGFWMTETAAPTLTANLKGDAVGANIYAAVQVSSGAVLRYDTAAKTWQSVSTVPNTVKNFPFIAANGNLYAVGGEQSSTAIALMQQYNPTVNSWTTKKSLTAARAYGGAALAGGMIYLLGSSASGTYTRNERAVPADKRAPSLCKHLSREPN